MYSQQFCASIYWRELIHHQSLALCWLYKSSVCSQHLFTLCQMTAQWTPKHLRTWPCGTALWGCGNSHRECPDQYDQLLALGNAQLQQQLRILTWEPATARKNEKKYWQIHLMPLFHLEFFVSHVGSHSFFLVSLFLIHLFASDFLVPIIFFKVPVFD